jgi:hypothetical protein
LIDDRLKDKLINNYGERLFEVVSRFKSLSWTAKQEIQEIINFLKKVPAPPSPVETIEQHLQKVADQLRQKNREVNTPPPRQYGYNLGYSDAKLKKLFHLIKDKYLGPKTTEDNFVNAFNGKELNKSFIPICWKEPTKGACFFSAFTENKNQWKKIEHLFEKAKYKTLLDNSRKNGTKDTYINDFNIIKTQLENN